MEVTRREVLVLGAGLAAGFVLRPDVAAATTLTSLQCSDRLFFLTFNGLPGPSQIPPLLRMLADHRAGASFLVPARDLSHCAPVRAQGHAIGLLGPPDLAHLVDASPPALCGFRPVGRTPSEATRRRIALHTGLPTLLWSLDAGTAATGMTRRITRHIHPGAILRHGIDPPQLATLPETLSALAGQGYRSIALPEIRRRGVPAAG